MIDGNYVDAERLPPRVNSTNAQYNAFIAADESYLIVPVFGRDDSFGGTDYYIVFRNESDEWSEPVNMGEKINTPRSGEYSPYVTRDGKYFFFMSTRGGSWEGVPDMLTYDYLWQTFQGPQNGNSNIYWVGAGFIEDIRTNLMPELRAAIEGSPQLAIELIQRALFDALGQFFVAGLGGHRDVFDPGADAEAAATLEVFRALAEARTRHGERAVGPCIISMARGPDDALAVLLLARAGACLDAEGLVPLDVVPLFETVEDLERAPATLTALLEEPEYARPASE